MIDMVNQGAGLEMAVTKLIRGAEKVVQALGDWPTFHDAEIISFSAFRAMSLEANSSSANLRVHVRQYQAVGEGTANYELALTKSVLISFLFGGLSHLAIAEFNHQNVIDSIQFMPTEDGEILVCIDAIWGLGGQIKCKTVSIDFIQELPVGDV